MDCRTLISSRIISRFALERAGTWHVPTFSLPSLKGLTTRTLRSNYGVAVNDLAPPNGPPREPVKRTGLPRAVSRAFPLPMGLSSGVAIVQWIPAPGMHSSEGNQLEVVYALEATRRLPTVRCTPPGAACYSSACGETAHRQVHSLSWSGSEATGRWAATRQPT